MYPRIKIEDKDYVTNFFQILIIRQYQKHKKVIMGYLFHYPPTLIGETINLDNLNNSQARNNTIILKEKNIAILNNYFPNGNPMDSEKFDFKIQMDG